MKSIISIIVAILLIGFAKYGKNHPEISKNEFINSLNNKFTRTLAIILAAGIILFEVAGLLIILMMLIFFNGLT